MNVSALLRFVPAYDTRHFVDDPSGAPELVVSTDTKRSRRSSSSMPTPIVVDHDLDRVVGHVRNLYVAEDVDYGTRVRKWWFASCEISDAPGWLKRGGGVSWSWNPLHTREVGETTVVARCLLKEISLLTPSTRPAEPLAPVRLVRVSHRRRCSPPIASSPVRASTASRGSVLIRPLLRDADHSQVEAWPVAIVVAGSVSALGSCAS